MQLFCYRYYYYCCYYSCIPTPDLTNRYSVCVNRGMLTLITYSIYKYNHQIELVLVLANKEKQPTQRTILILSPLPGDKDKDITTIYNNLVPLLVTMVGTIFETKARA